jgi:hypothetical protein
MIGNQIKIDFNDVNQDILLFSAFRYALGRRTYVVGAICEIIRANWDHMPESRKAMFKKEIREAISTDCAGSKTIDVPEWERILTLDGGNHEV